MQPPTQQRHFEVRLGKSFLKYYGGESVADKYPDAPEYSLFYCLFSPFLSFQNTPQLRHHTCCPIDKFKPAYVNEESYGTLTEKEDGKVLVDYQCPRDDTTCSFSGAWRHGDDTECLLVYDAAEQCYYLEKLATAYEGLKLRQKHPAPAAPPAGGLVPPEAPDGAPAPAPAPLLPPPPSTTTAPLVLNVPESTTAAAAAPPAAAAEPAPARKRQRRTSARQSSAQAAGDAAGDAAAPPKKPRKKRITKKEREAAAAAAAAAVPAAVPVAPAVSAPEGCEETQPVEREDSSAAFMRELEAYAVQGSASSSSSSSSEDEEEKEAAPVPSAPAAGASLLQQEAARVAEMQQQQQRQMQPSHLYDIQENEADTGITYCEESSSSSDSSAPSSDMSSSDDDDDDDDDDD